MMPLVLAGCNGLQSVTPDPSAAASAPLPAPTATARPPTGTPRKVLVVAEENHAYDEVIGNPDAPYLNRLARTYGQAIHADAGYPTDCPSLPAYLLMTSGSTRRICDDKPARERRLAGNNIFHQVVTAGRQWRGYAQSMQHRCQLDDAGRYVSRHAPATYYIDESRRCRRWQVPEASPSRLVADARTGHLQAYTLLTPDLCHDMHGGHGCPGGLVAAADNWLRTQLGPVLTSPDFRSGTLVIFVVWDEGSRSSNHVPLLVLSSSTVGVRDASPITNCSVLRTSEELLRLPLLGCARHATSLRTPFHLAS